MKFFFLLFCLAYFIKDSCGYQEAYPEQLIIKSILNSNYSSTTRPTPTTNITIKLTFNQIGIG